MKRGRRTEPSNVELTYVLRRMRKAPSGVLPVAPVETGTTPMHGAVVDDHQDLPGLVDLDVPRRASRTSA